MLKRAHLVGSRPITLVKRAPISSSRVVPRALASNQSQAEAEAIAVIEGSLKNIKGRGKEGLSESQIADLDRAFKSLEEIGGVSEPTKSPLINGKFTLIYTTRPGSASPIQRTFTGVDSFVVYQEVDLQGPSPKVSNVVEFPGDIGVLRVEALASSDSRPLAGFTPRKGDGKILGMAIMGLSENRPKKGPHTRIDFKFDEAYFNFFPGKTYAFRLPYPVPFRILGDDVKGWIDSTYLSSDGKWRIANGNKGTKFILRRAD